MTKKTESVKDFVERGGEIIIVPPEKPEEKKHVIKFTTGGLPHLMSLGEGENLYGETRRKKKKKLTNKDFKNKVENLNLPANIISSIINSVKDNNEQ